MIASCRPLLQLSSFLVTLLLGVSAVVALFVRTPLRQIRPTGGFNAAEAHVGEYDPSQYMTGVMYRSGQPTVEGYGSFLQMWKGAIATAMFLNKTLIIQQDHVQSEHGYFVSPQVNAVHAWPEMPQDDPSAEHVCEDNYYWGEHGIVEEDMLALMCLRLCPGSFNDPTDMFTAMGRPASDPAFVSSATRALAAWEAKYAKCTVIHSVQVEWKSRFEEFNDCVQPWLSYTLRGMFANRGYQSTLANNGRLNVGIHIRWGDLASQDVTDLDVRNMGRDAIIFTLQKLQESTVKFNFYMFAKNAIPALAEQFHIEHTLIDGDDDLYDMYLYSLMDVYILGSSSWSVMPTYVHSGRVIITDAPDNKKFWSVFRQTSYIYDYRNFSYIDHIARLRPQSAERAAATKPSKLWNHGLSRPFSR